MNTDVRVGYSLGYRPDNKMPRYDMHQGKLSKRIPATNLGGAHSPRQDHSPADVRQDGKTMRTEREFGRRKRLII